MFRWDPRQRESARRELHLDGKLVCVHLGSFFIWYDPDLIVQTFNRIRSYTSSAHLLVVTEDAERAKAYLAGRISPEALTVISARHDEVPNLLAASDVGFLLLRSTPNIAVASPAKFSEYLNSGLPVLITANVGDFSGMVANEQVGAIVADDGSFDARFIQDVLADRPELAARCATAGRQLGWPAFSLTWSLLMERLVTD